MIPPWLAIPVTYEEGALSVALEKIDQKIASLKNKIPSEGEVRSLAEEIGITRLVLSSFNARLDSLLPRLRFIDNVSHPGDSKPLVRALSSLDTKFKRVEEEQQIALEKEEELIENHRTPFPKKALLKALICPLSQKPLHDAILLSTGIRVNAFALGYCFREGRIQWLNDLSFVYQRMEEIEDKSAFGLEDFPEGYTPESFIVYQKAIQKKAIRDFKAIELALHFYPKGGQPTKRKPFSYPLLFDKVIGGVYQEPHLLPCGHVESKIVDRWYTCNTSCRKIFLSRSVVPHTLLESFIKACQEGCSADLIALEVKRLQNLVKLGLKKGTEEIEKLKQEREEIREKNKGTREALKSLQEQISDLEKQKASLKVQRRIQQLRLEQFKERYWQWEMKGKMISQLKSIKEEKRPYDEKLATLVAKFKEIKEAQREIEDLLAERRRPLSCRSIRVELHEVLKRCLEIFHIRNLRPPYFFYQNR